jgi:hypothetical protein
MRSRSLATAIVLALALPLAGCGDEETSAKDANDATDETSEELRTSVEAPTIELVDAGSEPRRQLLLDVEQGQVETTSMTMRQRQSFGDARPVETPPVTLTYRTEVSAVTEDRIDAEVVYDETTVEGAGADPELVEQLESALAPLTGMTGSIALSPSGEGIEQSFALPEDAPEVMKSFVTQFADQSTALMVPFPEEEVGPGATWTATTALELNGIEIEQTVDYTLEALTDDAYRISVDVVQSYVPGSASGFEVTGGHGRSHGVVRGSTALLTPERSTTHARTVVNGEAQGEQVSIGTRMSMDLTSELE